MLNASPESLILAVAMGRSRSAFAILFDEFAPRVKSYLMRLGLDTAGAEELVQDVFLTIWRRARTFDPTKSGASTWIFRIARNRRIDRLRHERHPDLLGPVQTAYDVNMPIPADAIVEAEQQHARLLHAIEELPEEQAELLRLAFFEEMSHKAIAAASDLPLGTIKSRLRLALAHLRKVMGAK